MGVTLRELDERISEHFGAGKVRVARHEEPAGDIPTTGDDPYEKVPRV